MTFHSVHVRHGSYTGRELLVTRTSIREFKEEWTDFQSAVSTGEKDLFHFDSLRNVHSKK